MRKIESHIIRDFGKEKLSKRCADQKAELRRQNLRIAALEASVATAREEGRKQGLDEAAADVRYLGYPHLEERILALKDKEPGK